MAANGSWIRVGGIKAHLDAKTINPIIETVLRKRAVSITQMPELRQQVGEEFLKVVTPFVPVNTGELQRSGRATNDGRLYWSVIRPTYANEGSYAFNYTNVTYDPNYQRWPKGETYENPRDKRTQPRWVECVHPGTDEWTTFVNNITPIIKEAFRDD